MMLLLHLKKKKKNVDKGLRFILSLSVCFTTLNLNPWYEDGGDEVFISRQTFSFILELVLKSDPRPFINRPFFNKPKLTYKVKPKS